MLFAEGQLAQDFGLYELILTCSFVLSRGRKGISSPGQPGAGSSRHLQLRPTRNRVSEQSGSESVHNCTETHCGHAGNAFEAIANDDDIPFICHVCPRNGRNKFRDGVQLVTECKKGWNVGTSIVEMDNRKTSYARLTAATAQIVQALHLKSSRTSKSKEGKVMMARPTPFSENMRFNTNF